jgi:AcrR family transcriptional regulator
MRDSYEQVGLRDIAKTAGVDAALVIRYFGSKEALFAEAVTQQFALGDLLDGARATLGERLTRYMLQKDHSPGHFDPVQALIRSSAHEQAGALLRAGLEQQFIGPLAAWLGGDDALVRASLIAAYLTGLAVTRDVLRLTPLADGETERLVGQIAPVLQRYIDGDAARAP